MDDLKLIAKSEEEIKKKKRCRQLKPSAMILMGNLDLKNVPRLRLREAS